MVILDHLLEVGGKWENKEEKKRREKRMILTRNNPFDFDGDLQTHTEVFEGKGKLNDGKRKKKKLKAKKTNKQRSFVKFCR